MTVRKKKAVNAKADHRRRTRTRRASARATCVKPICTYEVTYQFFSYEFIEITYRLRCVQLDTKQMQEHKTLFGEIAVKHGNKWGPFGMGSLPGAAENTNRIIREHREPPIALAAANP